MAQSEGISKAEVDKAVKTALTEISGASSIGELKKAKGSILGDGSALASLSARLGKLPADQSTISCTLPHLYCWFLDERYRVGVGG